MNFSMTRTWLAYLLAFLLLGAGIAGVIHFDVFSSGNTSSGKDGSTIEPTTLQSPLTAHPSKAEPVLPPGVQIKFVDVTEKAGIHFQHFDGHTEMEYIMETTGSGLGWLDYDQDGLMDLFIVQGSTFSATPGAQGADAPRSENN